VEREKKILTWPVIIFLILAPFIFRTITGLFTGGEIGRVRAKIEKYLYEKYGEEFVVDQIGLRGSGGGQFYQARIYPVSIIGTNKEWDSYYYGKATIDKRVLGLGGVADSYGEIKRSLEIENILLPEAKEIFGERVLLKVDQRYEKRNERGNFICYLNPSYEEIKKKMIEEPGDHRILLDLDVYIFDRIDNETEKEKRRKQIFEFIQYLKEEGLFEYLEMGVIFIDERVLAPGYDDFSYDIYVSDKVREEVDGEIVYMPPMELRKRMSRVLQAEIDKMSEEELLESMGQIRKSDLSYDVLDKYNATHYGLIYSVGILQEKYKTAYERYIENNQIDNYYYNDISNVKIGRNLEYAYIK
jgi:hypothetical protein